MSGRGSEYGLRGSVRQALTLAPPRGMLYRDAHYFTATVEVDVTPIRFAPGAGLSTIDHNQP